MDRGYPEFGYYLNQTGRPMIYACSWPVYQTYSGMTVNILSCNFVQLFKNFIMNQFLFSILDFLFNLNLQPNYTSITGTCNIWRNFDDIQDSWQSVANVIDYYGDNQDTIIPNAGPGHWNDPDMVYIYNKFLY